jgi:hypothetical protein
MNREEAEQKIAEKLKEIKAITEEYGMVSGYLTLLVLGDNIMFNNEYWEVGEDYEAGRDYEVNKILNYSENLKEV